MPVDELLAAVAIGDVPPDRAVHLWPHHVTATLGPVPVRIHSNSTTAIDYLNRLFTPGNDLWAIADQGDYRHPALSVRCHFMDAESTAALVQHVSAGTQPSPRTPTRLHVDAPAEWIDLDGHQRVLLAGGVGQPIAPQLVTVRGASEITIICCNTPDALMNLARHLREIGYRLAENDGWICLHASAADLDGQAVAIVGESGAGKSTMALALSARPGWRFLANDRLMVRLDPGTGSLRAVAMPCPIRLNAGTLRGLEIDDAHEWELSRPRPGHESDWAQFRGAAKLNVLPSEWRELTGADLSPAGSLAAVLLPTPILGGTEIRIAKHFDPTTAITAQCMSPDDPVYVSDWLGRRSITPERVRAHAHQIVASVAALPALQVDFGTGLALTPVADRVAAALQAIW
jgi:hypothetical protein